MDWHFTVYQSQAVVSCCVLYWLYIATRRVLLLDELSSFNTPVIKEETTKHLGTNSLQFSLSMQPGYISFLYYHLYKSVVPPLKSAQDLAVDDLG
jgi:hypothetical protein